jgi:cobalt/nickel transport protein
MKRRLDGLIWIGLGVSLLLALFLSPFASSSPDGLEKVAEMKGFSEKGEGWKVWKYAPFSEYAIPWIKNEKVSTALSGLIGTLAIFFIAMGIGKLIKRSTAQKALFLIILFFSLSSPAFALRPLTTDDAYTVGRGTFQLEAGMALEALIFFPAQSIGTAVYLFDNSWIFFHLHVELSNLEKNLDQKP